MSSVTDGKLLAQVSRSFGLSIRVLPATLRKPIGLAYLLARATDTVADACEVGAPTRREALDRMGAALAGRGEWRASQEILAGSSGAERVLLDVFPECLQALETLSETDRADVRLVLAEIIEGQQSDLQAFPEGLVGALPDTPSLERYTYLVAGCVGAFWTRLCFRHLPQCANRTEPEMIALGVRFGCGLQLVNVLRDFATDLKSGRCYLPEQELEAEGVSLAALQHDPALARDVHRHWIGRAREQLSAGAEYVRGLQKGRLRLAVFLPLMLAMRTLEEVELRFPACGVKVPRKEVSGWLARGLIGVAIPCVLERALVRYFGRK